MSYSHSRKPDLPVTHSSPLSTWLSVLFFFSSPLKPRCQGRDRNCPTPIIVCALYCKHQIAVYGFSFLHFYGCLRLRFLDAETNPGPRRWLLIKTFLKPSLKMPSIFCEFGGHNIKLCLNKPISFFSKHWPTC